MKGRKWVMFGVAFLIISVLFFLDTQNAASQCTGLADTSYWLCDLKTTMYFIAATLTNLLGICFVIASFIARRGK